MQSLEDNQDIKNFLANIDLNDAYNKANINVEKISKIISSKKEEIKELETFRDHLLKERNEVSKKLNKIKKNKDIQDEKEKEKKNLISPLSEEMELSSIPAKIHDYEDLNSYLKDEYKDKEIDYDLNCSWFEDGSVKFGDIIDTVGNRHYGYMFAGKNGVVEHTKRLLSIDSEEGVTVPFNICKYLTDSVSKYSNFEFDESCIVAYELPYHDKTVQKYNVEEDHLYEFTCWDERIEQFDFDNWILVQIDTDEEKTYPSLKKAKKTSKKLNKN